MDELPVFIQLDSDDGIYIFFVVTAILGTVHKRRLKDPPLFGGWICLLLQVERRKRRTYSAGLIRMRIFKSPNVPTEAGSSPFTSSPRTQENTARETP
jgi:hypothetical protein